MQRIDFAVVSTHSRPKAADNVVDGMFTYAGAVSTHSRPKAAEAAKAEALTAVQVSTHSRPKAADCSGWDDFYVSAVSTHSRPKAAEKMTVGILWCGRMFQHTAARRRLKQPRSLKP